MKIEQSTALKLVISGVPNHDPINVFLEDFSPGRGKITISTWDRSWVGSWNAMGNRDIASFFVGASVSYIAGNMFHGADEVVDAEAIEEKVKREIIKQRREHDISKRHARELWNDVPSIDPCIERCEQLDPTQMHRIFGDEWWYSIPMKTSADYIVFSRIVEVVQQALLSRMSEKKAA